jgi:ankyrin repeat protein
VCGGAPAQDLDQRTPLHWASYNGHLECVRLLLERGADKEARDRVRAPLG